MNDSQNNTSPVTTATPTPIGTVLGTQTKATPRPTAVVTATPTLQPEVLGAQTTATPSITMTATPTTTAALTEAPTTTPAVSGSSSVMLFLGLFIAAIVAGLIFFILMGRKKQGDK
jgi:hypothetical protein